MNAHPLSRRLGASLAALAAGAIVLVPASPAAAHHGWDGFDTDHLVYVAGTVSSDGSWGDPHSHFDVTLDSELPADTPELAIPEELQNPEDSIRVDAALAYDGPHEGLEVIIAPPTWSGRWGLDRPLATDERFQGVGYINRADDGLFRPVVFWYGDDQVPVNQVLGNTLPAHAPLPDAAASPDEARAPAPSSGSAVPAPSEAQASSPATSAEASSGEDGTGTWGVWTAFGLLVAAAVVGGLLYLRRRTLQS